MTHRAAPTEARARGRRFWLSIHAAISPVYPGGRVGSYATVSGLLSLTTSSVAGCGSAAWSPNDTGRIQPPASAKWTIVPSVAGFADRPKLCQWDSILAGWYLSPRADHVSHIENPVPPVA